MSTFALVQKVLLLCLMQYDSSTFFFQCWNPNQERFAPDGRYHDSLWEEMKVQSIHRMWSLCWCLPGAEKQEFTKWQSHEQQSEWMAKQAPSDVHIGKLAYQLWASR